MKTPNKGDSYKWLFDIVAILSIVSMPLWVFTPQKIGTEYELHILSTICFFYSLRLIQYPKKYVLRLCIAASLACGLATLIFGSASGYILFFYYRYIKGILIAGLLGFLGAKIYIYGLKRLQISTQKQGIITLSVFVIAICFLGMSGNNFVSRQTSLSNEIDKRYNFLKEITKTVVKNEIEFIDNQSAIDIGIVEPFYKFENTKIFHGYGGEIRITSNTTGVSVEYLGIPGGNPCYNFYFMNSPEVFGFRQTFVDGKSIKTKTSTQAINKMKNKLCYSGQEQVAIRYEASLKQLRSAARFIR